MKKKHKFLAFLLLFCLFMCGTFWLKTPVPVNLDTISAGEEENTYRIGDRIYYDYGLVYYDHFIMDPLKLVASSTEGVKTVDLIERKVYSVDGCDQKDYLNMWESFGYDWYALLLVGEEIEEIPYRFLQGNIASILVEEPAGSGKLYFGLLEYEGRTYHLFSKALVNLPEAEPVGMAVELSRTHDEFGRLTDPKPRFSEESQIFVYPGKPVEQWIIVQSPGSEERYLYYSDEEGMETVPVQFIKWMQWEEN